MRTGLAVGPYADAAMSELRRNGGPDDGDKTADAVSNTDSPARRPNLEIRSADQNPDWPVDRRKVTTTQRHFLNIEKESADSPIAGGPVTTLSADWKTGESADSRHAPPSRDKGRKKPDDSPYADPPPDFHRDNADLEARTIQRTDAEPAEDYGEIVKRGRPERRRKTEFLKNGEDLVQDAGNGVQTVHDLMSYRPPAGHTETKVPKNTTTVSDHPGPPSIADVTASAMAAGLVLGAAGHKIYETIKERKERRVGNE